MELRHLRYFEAVARYSHVTRAAAELHIAQPALSKQISQLEQELGVALFDRVGRNVRLTEAGEALLPHARAVMAQVESARAEMAERIGLRRGRASVGTPPTVGTQLLPRVLAAFNRHYPGIELRLHEAGVQTLFDLLEAGLTDVGIVTLPVEDEHLTVVPLFTEEMVIVVCRDHPLAAQGMAQIADFQDASWVLSPENYELREATLTACQKAGFTPRVVLDGGETDTLLRFVAAGIGIALVPRLAVQETSEVMVLRVTDQKLERTLGLVWRGDRVASPAARALRDFLVAQLKRSVYV
ncbi:LysR family transcriptional regulator [Candidatus Chloroploca sp. M-50]|uniref:LysR family transcriptional regulator n=1 Tax=Candidatus Chloroploca mongolica TaxID=2528176 RepID=A0ABS4DGC9_9CHLR|nr:LysR family transcriptional regulator [Candidatus Chloroploca mongolica]MBP1468480.1 LysR family transcriptional regulator [Candidatus Chloroploca mongolica]